MGTSTVGPMLDPMAEPERAPSGAEEPPREPDQERLLEPLEEDTPEDRRRVYVIAAFVIGTAVLAIVLAIFYSMPSAP